MNYSQKQLNKIAHKYQLDLVMFYGSQARNQSSFAETDLDIAIYRKKPFTTTEFSQLYLELSTVFPRQDLDLKSLFQKNPLFCYKVVRDGQLLFGDQTTFNELKAYYYHKRIDLQPLLNLESALVEKYQKILNYE